MVSMLVLLLIALVVLYIWVIYRAWMVGDLREEVRVLQKRLDRLEQGQHKEHAEYNGAIATSEPQPSQESFAPATPPTATPPSVSPPPAPPPPAPPEPISFQNHVNQTPRAKTSPLLMRLAGQNPVVVVGVVVLLFGIAFLIRLAVQAGLFPPSLRLASASGVALVMLGMGWFKRKSHPHFALPLQGGALGALFLVVFAAQKLYGLIPASASLPMAVFLVASTGLLAALQNALPLAFLGLVTGFAAPLALSTGSGNHVTLFSYYLILNAAVFGLARLRSWRSLHVAAFVFTYGVAVLWGATSWNVIHAWSCEIFLWLFYLLFSGTALVFARHDYRGIKGYVDGTLVFGLPLITLGLHAHLVERDAMLMAYAAAFMALHHLGAGLWLYRSVGREGQEHLRPLAETLGVLGTVFGSLAIPLAFSGQWTAVTWAIEGAGLVFLGIRQNRPWSLGIGILLALGAVVFQWHEHIGYANPETLGEIWGLLISGLVASIGLMVTARWVQKAPESWQPQVLSGILLGLGWLWMVVECAWWADSLLHSWTILNGAAGAIVYGSPALWGTSVMGLTLLLAWVGYRLRWNAVQGVLLAALGMWLLLTFVATLDLGSNAWGLWRDWGWGVFLAVPLFTALVLRWQHYDARVDAWLHSMLGHGVLWIAAVQISQATWTWGEHTSVALGFAVIPIALWVIARKAPSLWLGWGQWPLVLAAMLWVVRCTFASATHDPLPYIPLVNPTDICAWATLLALTAHPRNPWGRKPILVFFMVWLGTTLNRAFHHYAQVSWDWQQLWDSRALQSGWSLLLTAQALALMFGASRIAAKRSADLPATGAFRSVWIIGAVLLAISVGKLFFVDLSGQGTVARIVSFLGVGALTVAIGYLSPLPPALPTKAPVPPAAPEGENQ